MPTVDVVRAWTDTEFRAGLTPDQLAALPAHPAGSVDAMLDQLDGAGREECPITSFSRNPCCY